MHHDEIRIGAYHRQPAGERGVHDRRVSLDRIIPFGRAGVQDEVRLSRRVDKREVQPLADFEVALGTDMQAAVPERGIERHLRVEQVLVRQGEFAGVVVVVQVVAEHQHEGEPACRGEVTHHRVGDRRLRRVAAAAVADQRERRRARDLGEREERFGPAGGRRWRRRGNLARRRRVRERFTNEVDDHVGVDIAQDQGSSTEGEVDLLW